jgi:hypothetical protein
MVAESRIRAMCLSISLPRCVPSGKARQP